ncbi:putative lipoprotein [Fimbriimonas ginsengisoli Gsoil 348]|uniref:Putative lipoprotein n=1 Tax=Fimbriimonas ginsengisoli Gsoil 348 TaxID=661478 RepID=A0A068NUA8_FIMGI|nr:putative lipoprotein [Fimbriimonas ginsengisoli Gsoil 348]
MGRYSLPAGAFLGNLNGGILDGTLASRVGPDGKLYVASELTNGILRYDARTGRYLDTFASGIGFSHPTGIAFAKGAVLVGNFEKSTVSKFDSKGRFLGPLVGSQEYALDGPDVGMVVGPDGVLYVPSFNNGAVLKFDPGSGRFLGYFLSPGGIAQPRTILFRKKLVWISSDSGNQVLRYKMNGSFVDTFIQPGSNGLKGASGMAFGGDGFLYVSSWHNNKVLRYKESDGSPAGALIETGLSGPTFLTVVR